MQQEERHISARETTAVLRKMLLVQVPVDSLFYSAGQSSHTSKGSNLMQITLNSFITSKPGAKEKDGNKMQDRREENAV